MIIRCQECDCYLGEIRDATLKKNMSYLCSECNGTLSYSDSTNNDEALNQLKNIFGFK
jgi:predicted SprT family Zn-dependent metalloprotease